MDKIYMRWLLLLALPLLTLGTAACSQLLDEIPDERVYPRSPEDIQKLLVSSYPEATFAYLTELASDNVDDYGTDVPEYTNADRDAVYWLDGQEYNNHDGLRRIWERHYKAIQHANRALQGIDELGNTSSLAPARGEALLIRAYSHFVLVNLFGAHYNATTSATDLGVPYMTAPESELDPKYKRNTVAEVYAAIDRDLTEGLPLINDSYYAQPRYHFNSAAAHAFAARFYLYWEQWAKAEEQATLALVGKEPRRWADFQDASLVGARTEDAYAKLYSRSTQEANFLILPVYTKAHDAFSYAKDRRFSMTHRVADEIFLGQNIWRNSVTAQADYWQVPFVSSQYNYRDIIYQAKFPTYPARDSRSLYVPFTAEETLLVRAEARILQQKYAEGLEDLNTWMAAYLNVPKTSFTETEVQTFWDALSYSTDTEPTMKKQLHPHFALTGGAVQEALLQQLLQCRRVATAHEGLRWFDLRRYGITIYRYVHDRRDRERFSTAKTLSRDDAHFTFQIPQNARSSGMTPNLRPSTTTPAASTTGTTSSSN